MSDLTATPASSSVQVPEAKTAPKPKPAPARPHPKADQRLAPAKERKRAQKALKLAQEDVERVAREHSRLKYLLWLMVTTWPIGFIWNWGWAAYIAVGWACLWGVGKYINFFHTRNARIRLEEATERWARAAPTDVDDAAAQDDASVNG